MQQSFKVRDRRERGWFWLDNDYLNGYAKYFGATGAAIYISLCRHANNETQKCFPSQKLIAEELGISPRTVRKNIKKFEKYNLIVVQKERSPKTGKWLRNVYTLLDKAVWKKPEVKSSYGNPKANNNTSRRQVITEIQRHELHNNKTDSNNKTNDNKTKIDYYKIAPYKAIPVSEFIPKSREEDVCHQIARELGEQDMRFILSALKRYGLEKIEEVWGIIRETKGIRDKRKYFNKLINQTAPLII